jgi:hypothetical protein
MGNVEITCSGRERTGLHHSSKLPQPSNKGNSVSLLFLFRLSRTRHAPLVCRSRFGFQLQFVRNKALAQVNEVIAADERLKARGKHTPTQQQTRVKPSCWERLVVEVKDRQRDSYYVTYHTDAYLLNV